MEKNSDIQTCPKEGCGYESSKQGVKIHYGRSHEGSISGVLVECEECGEEIRKDEYRLDRSENLFCGPECYHKWKKENMIGEDAGGWQGGIATAEFTCDNCGAENVGQRQRVEKYDMSFCDENCMAEFYASGYVPSGKEHKWYGEDRSGKNNPLYGVTGKNHPGWKGGHDGDWRRGVKWRRLAKEVRKRDGYTCQRCKQCGELHVHHIQPVSEGGAKYNMENLITLCMECHNHVHSNEYEGNLISGGD